MRSKPSSAIVLAVFAAFPGCIFVPAPPPPPPDDVLAQPGESGRTALTHNDFHHNGLSVEALQKNEAIRTRLAANRLNQATLTQMEMDGLVPVDAMYLELTQELLKYIVSCALSDSPDRTLSLGGEQLPGELGLCDGWSSLPPSEECLQIVSSCVLARVNAVGKRVIISVRGGGIPLLTEVPVETEWRGRMDPDTMRHTPERITSFDLCADPLTPTNDSTRNCGWVPRSVGRCKAGEMVTIKAESAGVMLRVCKGLYGCEDPNGVPKPVLGPFKYADFLVDSNMSDVTFQCPVNGPLVDGEESWTPMTPSDAPRYGYFSVMIADQAPPAPKDDLTYLKGIAVNASSPTDPMNMNLEYPATEEHVFTYREGAFYGNIFSFSGNGKPMLGGPDAKADMNACYGQSWSCGLAHLTDRFCAGAGSVVAPTTCDVAGITNSCFKEPPEACMDEWLSHRCTSDLGSPGDYYGDCASSGGSPRWLHPITVYLNHPCDLSDDGQCAYSEVGKSAHIPLQ